MDLITPKLVLFLLEIQKSKKPLVFIATISTDFFIEEGRTENKDEVNIPQKNKRRWVFITLKAH